MSSDFVRIWKIFVNRLALVLIVLFFIVAGYMDVLHNKLIDKGLDYEVTFSDGVQAPAIVLWWGAFIIIFLGYFVFVLKRILRHNDKKDKFLLVLDAIAAFFALFAMIVNATMTFIMAYKVDVQPVRLLFFVGTPIAFYHVSLTVMGLAAVYFVITEFGLKALEV